MDPKRHERVSSLFSAACALEGAERRALLERECAGDGALLAAVEALLAEDAASGSFLGRPLLARALGPSLAENLIGRRIGNYCLTRVIASGGMGTVYEALQDSPRRTVALKLMRQGLASPSALRRFEYESQLLARLHHPAIAQIHEAGTYASDAGTLPFFAMEYVDGARTLTEFARDEKLPVEARLELFRRVCDAVHHGHQKGVIHRDLKPANILVDREGQVKVIDFGVARATDSDIAATTMRTAAGQLVGTLQYMSPEQCGEDPHAIDTRSDVYALGVVLYELLCDRLPYDVQRVALHDALRTIREVEPSRPSTVRRALRGDVETIALKALEKNRERRYPSAAELEQDIRRYLSGEPIWARPPSASYQLRMFARRHRALVAGTAAVALSLVLGLAGTTHGMLRAERERLETEQRSKSLRAASELLQQILLEAHPNRARGRDVSVAEALDAAGRWIESQDEVDPHVEAWVRFTLADVLQGQGRNEAALEHAERALALWRAELGEGHGDTLDAASLVARIYVELGRAAEAETLIRRTLELRRERFGADSEPARQSLNSLGNLLRSAGRAAEAEPLLRDAWNACLRAHGSEHAETRAAQNNLALALEDLGRLDDARALWDELFATQGRVYALDHPYTIRESISGGALLIRLGDDAKAAEVLSAAIECAYYVVPDDVRLHHMALEPLVQALRNLERYDEAVASLERQLWFDRQVLGDDHEWTMQAVNMLGITLQDCGRLEAARPHLASVYDSTRRRFGDCDLRTAVSAHCLAYQHMLEGDEREAERLFRESLAIDQSHPDVRPEQVATTELCLGILLAREKRDQEAESLLQSAYASYSGMYGADHYQAARARKWLDGIAKRRELPGAPR